MTSFAYYNSPIGKIRITAGAHAITDISFVEDEKPLPAGEPLPLLEQCVTQLREYFEAGRSKFDFPIAQAGTEFQQRVWRELSKIPYGRTICYEEQARRMGNVKAVRAVGTANGRNSLSIVVPCHRVVGKDGSLTGYAGGLWRKQWLLEHERKVSKIPDFGG
ncbi:MAG: methylated-DNA--[protein]-cysteine S-methyltransferase [Prevotellaceae bacterium]|jgi:methylated-DNA-[protein]-cysteine S-methyltransferase|nr:methylated-DNA--[protein]-cysteine S-methyltransferase [Prevotellaceae bacterium]